MEFGAWLRQQRLDRGWDITDMAQQLLQAARASGKTPPGSAFLHRNINRWETGQNGMSERYRLLYCQVLGIAPGAFGPSPQHLLEFGDPRGHPAGHPSQDPPGLPDERLLATLAAESQAFGEWAATSPISDETITRYGVQVRRLARDFESAAFLPLLAETRQLRDLVTTHLRGRQHPRQARELYLIATQIFGCLAWMTGDLGNYRAADAHAWTAWMCAGQAGHDAARAWVRVTQAKLAYWDGRYGESAQLAEDGLTYLCTDSARVFLELFRARALARAGNHGPAAQALQQAARQQDRVQAPDLLGGIWELTPARFHGLTAGTLLLLRRPRQAAAEAAQAIQLSQAAPASRQHLYAEMLFRTDHAQACLCLPDLDATSAALRPVLSLPADRRTEPVVQQLTGLRDQLARPAFTAAPLARDLREEITAYASSAALNRTPAPLPDPSR
jgi:hypothetical protein